MALGVAGLGVGLDERAWGGISRSSGGRRRVSCGIFLAETAAPAGAGSRADVALAAHLVALCHFGHAGRILAARKAFFAAAFSRTGGQRAYAQGNRDVFPLCFQYGGKFRRDLGQCAGGVFCWRSGGIGLDAAVARQPHHSFCRGAFSFAPVASFHV
ncbi:hypothetical protein DSECCO2_561740 [anaerobic digester metagenome]